MVTLYGSNIFLLRVLALDSGVLGIYGHTRNALSHRSYPAEVWLTTRSPEALQDFSRVILQFWDEDNYFTGMDMVLFEPRLKTYKIISEAGIEGYGFLCRAHSVNECACRSERWERKRDFDDVLEVAAWTSATSKGPIDKHLRLIEAFQDALRESTE